jgi:predicted Zn finger-like uncharacterized protein
MIADAMLVTSCPQCATVFRVSDEILEKAAGRVRCGRCAHVYDARTTLREVPDGEAPSVPPGAGSDRSRSGEPAAGGFGTEAGAGTPVADTDSDAGSASAAETDRKADRESEATPTPESEPASSRADTDAGTDAGDPAADTDWLPVLNEPRRRRTWPWLAGIVILALAFGLQLVHEFRGALSTWPVVGGGVRRVYAALGLDATPTIDLAQYELLDLTAVAEPVTQDQGWLIIETRVRNKGPKIQPVPHVFVALLDRWQQTVAGRYFAPDEFVVGPDSDLSGMQAGETVDAQFIIVDPGPGATGFELRICTPMEHGFACDGDPDLE